MAEAPFIQAERATGSSRVLSITSRLGLGPTIVIVCSVLSALTAAMAYLTHLAMQQPMGLTGTLNSIVIPFLLGAPTLYVLLTLVNRLESTRAQLARLSSIDVLTGCLNRRAILAFAEHQLREVSAQARSGGRGLMAIALMDVDHFKHINDRHGHLVGDAVLRHLVEVARAALPENCALGRFGGEEFAVVMPGRDLETATAIAQALRAAVEAQAAQQAGQSIQLTVSLGVVSSTRDSLEEMLAKADRALYQAKDRGRNRVERFHLDANTQRGGVNVIPI